MADYQPLIARAVSGLDKSTGENRRALYERARTALVNQLRGVEPALDESDITRERLALEDAIRKVEAEAVKRTLAEPAEPPAAAKPAADQGMHRFRANMADAEGLGDAAAAANRSAHDFYEAVPGDHPPRGDIARPAAPYFEPPTAEPQDLADAEMVHPADTFPAPRGDRDEEMYRRPPRSYGRVVKWVVLLLVLAGLAGGAYWQRGPIMTMVAKYRTASPQK